MHKIHIVQRRDGSVLVVAVLNPGAPQDVAQRTQRSLVASLNAGDKVMVVPYATAVVATQETLVGQLRNWWAARRLKARCE